MIREAASGARSLKVKEEIFDLVVVGGGLAGVCAAIAAAREGLKVVLVQDRPVLGGNASSEIRLWANGATSHGGNNNRWAREGGILNEILLENLYRNRIGNPVIFDMVLLDWVTKEANLKLLTNTSVFHLEADNNQIQSIQAFNPQNSTLYQLSGQYFVDASGDGILAHLSGAAYRMGAEESEEFDEPMAPGDGYGKLLGHSIYFYTKDIGKAVDYVAPDFAHENIPDKIPNYRRLSTKEHGCSLWWIEYGGRLDTIYDSEEIKFELQKIVYGVWDFIKNSGDFPEAETMTLEWVGTIPGKRESRRVEGDYMLNQKDIIEQVQHYDNITHGGWSIDLHPADGVYGSAGSCNQYHSRGIFGIPYRTMYSRNITNLLVTGRLISASHVAFGSTRIMATCAANGQAVGTAAAICAGNNWQPKDLAKKEHIDLLKQKLSLAGHYVIDYSSLEHQNLASSASLSSSSQLELKTLTFADKWLKLNSSFAQLIPVTNTVDNQISFPVSADKPTTLQVEIRTSSNPENFTPDTTLLTESIALPQGESTATITLPASVAGSGYRFITLMENSDLSIGLSDQRITGLLSVQHGGINMVSSGKRQDAPEGMGVESFEFWTPTRRPAGHNMAFHAEKPLHTFLPSNLIESSQRPISKPNAWVASLNDQKPSLSLTWGKKVTIETLCFYLDCDYDHPLECVQMQHADRIMPYLLSDFSVYADGELVTAVVNNHQGVIRLQLDKPLSVSEVQIHIEKTQGSPAAMFGLQVQ